MEQEAMPFTADEKREITALCRAGKTGAQCDVDRAAAFYRRDPDAYRRIKTEVDREIADSIRTAVR